MKKVWIIGALSLLALLVVAMAGVHRWFNPPPPPVQLFTNGTIPVSYTHLTLPTICSV